MLKRKSVNNLFDKFHKGFVLTCVGITLYGSYLLSLRVHRYFTVIRPAKQERELEKANSIKTEFN